MCESCLGYVHKTLKDKNKKLKMIMGQSNARKKKHGLLYQLQMGQGCSQQAALTKAKII